MTTARYSFARIRGAVMMGFGVALVATAFHVCAGFLPERMWHDDFSHFYLSAKLLHSRIDVYQVPLHDYARTVGFPDDDLMTWETNPPLLMWLLGPLGALRVGVAFWLYVIIQVISVAAIFLVAWYCIGRRLSGEAWLFGLGLSLCSYPMLYHLWLSQAQLPLLALVMVGYGLWRRGWSGWATMVFALAGVTKLFPLALVPLPALAEHGKKSVQLWILALCSILGFALIPGLPTWISFGRHALPVLRSFAEQSRCNFTLAFLIGHLLRSADVNSRLVMAAQLVSTLAIVGYSWACCRRVLLSKRPADMDLGFCLLLVSSLLGSVIVWSHYLVFMIYPLLCVSSEIASTQRWQRVRLTALVITSLLVFNIADVIPIPTIPGLLVVILDNTPTLVLGLLFWHFIRRINNEAPEC